MTDVTVKYTPANGKETTITTPVPLSSSSLSSSPSNQLKALEASTLAAQKQVNEFLTKQIAHETASGKDKIEADKLAETIDRGEEDEDEDSEVDEA